MATTTRRRRKRPTSARSASASTRKRARTAKRASGKRAGRQTVHLAEAPHSTRVKVLRDVRKVLKAHGVAGDLSELHVEPPAAAPATGTTRAAAVTAAVAPAAAPPCPTGTVRRVVCFFRQGTFVCEERCVPV